MNTTIDLLADWTTTPTGQAGGGVRFEYPKPTNARGFFTRGFMPCCDTAFDATEYVGLALRVHTDLPNTTVTVAVTCLRNPAGGNGAVGGADPSETHTAVCSIAEPDDHDLVIPWSDFDIETANRLAWQYVSAVTVEAGTDVEAKADSVGVESDKAGPKHNDADIERDDGFIVLAARLLRARGLAAECAIKGRAVDSGQNAVYVVDVLNCLDHAVAVSARQIFDGWESTRAIVEPATAVVESNATTTFTVRIPVHDGFVPGGSEHTCIRFTPDGDDMASDAVELVTMRTLPHPYLVHTADGWRDVAARIRDYPKFAPEHDRWHALADQWEPQPTADNKPYCYFTDVEDHLMACAYLHMLGEDAAGNGTVEPDAYVRRIIDFFRYFTDAENGYPARRRGCHQSFVQEGQFFQHLAIAYDAVAGCGPDLLTDADRTAVEHTFRLYMTDIDRHIRGGEISNWLLAEIVGAFDCALALGDMERADRFLNGPGGIIEQFRYGTLNDGWWHECSIGYNTWVSGLFLHVCHTLEPFGIRLAHTRFPVPFNRGVNSAYACEPRAGAEPATWVREKWGGNLHATLGFKDLFDASLKFLDYRGVMIGINDSDEKKITAEHWTSTYDLAYRYYRDPEYLPIIARQDVADPVFGFGEIPDADAARAAVAVLDGRRADDAGTGIDNKPAYLRNAYSDNVGIAMLRSQTSDREPREQIQAVLHYGSHGGAHGHFDITDLLSVMRYGRSLFNPENNWWGYRNFMYKWHVQNSLTKNMVNVDDRMQLPADSKRTLFYTGRALQAAAVDTTCVWAYPPYCGMDYDDSAGDFAKRLRMNHLSFPVDPDLTYAATSGETEPIRQRRVMAVTDDYIVLFDLVQGERAHQYETTWQFKGFRGLTRGGESSGDGDGVTATGHTDQYTTESASDGQMITDCTWYRVAGASRASFRNEFTADEYEPELRSDRSFYNEPGVLNTDVYTAWPKRTTQVVGNTAMYFGWATDYDGYNVPFDWAVLGDRAADTGDAGAGVAGEGMRELAHGSLNGWILGRDETDVRLDGVRRLTLRVRQHDVANEKGEPVRTPQSVFWGSAVLELADGSTVALADLPYETSNIDAGHGVGRDYEGGRVTIQGREFPQAIPSSTVDHGEPGELVWNLDALRASGTLASEPVRLRACVGVDAFPGSEDQARRFYAVRAAEPSVSARFITVLEPYGTERRVLRVNADSATSLDVTLTDGRVQRISLSEGSGDGSQPRLDFLETINGRVLRRETASGCSV